MRAVVVLALSLFVVACGESRGRRAWRPSDHAQPPGAGSAPRASGAVSEEDSRRQAGSALFRVHCAACHGALGRGDGPASASMAVPDLTALARDAARSDAEIAEVIRNGRGAMPGFGSEIDDIGIEILVAHVRELGPTDDPE